MMMNYYSKPLTSSTQTVDKAPVLLRAEGIRKSFGGQVVLDGIDLELHTGEFVLLRGENGSGKTTLLNILTGNLEPESGTITYLAEDNPRTYRFPRSWWQNLNPFDHFTPEFVAREGVGRTWQNVRLFGSLSLRDNISIADPNHSGEKLHYALFSPGSVSKNEIEIRTKTDSLLKRLGLSGRADSSADKVSLGQSKRIAIARAVAAGARILFLDEPLAGLDQQGITAVLSLFESLRREYNITIVVIEHIFNLACLHEFATTEWLLTDRILIHNNCDDLPEETTPAGKHNNFKRPAWLHQFISKNDIVTEETLPNHAHITRVRSPDFIVHPSNPTLSIIELELMRGNRTLNWECDSGKRGLNLSVYSGEVVFLQAPNGWGKTTLLESIVGLLPVYSGVIRLNDKKLNGMKTWECVKAGIRMVQSTQNVFLNMSGNDMLFLAGASRNDFANDKNLLKHSISEYSGGQRQQLALSASCNKNGVKVLIYDEPFSMLDSKSLDHYCNLFRPNKNLAILVTVPLTSISCEDQRNEKN